MLGYLVFGALLYKVVFWSLVGLDDLYVCYRALLRVAFRLMRFVLAMVVLCPVDLLISWLGLYLISFTLFAVGFICLGFG